MAVQVDNSPNAWTKSRLKESIDGLGYPFFHKLGRKLDIESMWRDLAANLPNTKFQDVEIEKIGMAVSRYVCSKPLREQALYAVLEHEVLRVY